MRHARGCEAEGRGSSAAREAVEVVTICKPGPIQVPAHNKTLYSEREEAHASESKSVRCHSMWAELSRIGSGEAESGRCASSDG